MEQAKIYLCRADSGILGTLTGIQEQTCLLKRNATDLWELTFDVNRYIDMGGRLVQSDYYDSVDDMMRLYLESADIQAFFVIDSEPVIKGDGYQETKSVTAHSIECELRNLYLKNFKVNCGTPDSQEYLTDNLNPYTGLPYEYINLVNYEKPQLSLLHLVLQGTGWTVKEGMAKDLCEIKKSFETSDCIYTFLMKTVSPAASVIFEFDRKKKLVGIVKAQDYGEDTGVFITMRNLMNSFEVSGTSNDNIITKLIPTGANHLGIEQVNFGKDYILNLDYFMNTRNEYGDYKFVSKELHDKYNSWKHYRDKEQISIYVNQNTDLIQGTRREVYIELTKRYNQTLSDISELKNRVPNDGCLIDYKTYPLEELEAAHTAYTNALLALITIYKKDYGVDQIGDRLHNYEPVPEGATNIKDTPYWYDFYAYQEKIIPSIEQALALYGETDQSAAEIDSYLYEWSLYGLDELEAKKKAWFEAANLLFDDCFIISNDDNTSDTSAVIYRTPDNNGWNSLSDTQKQKFTSQAAFCRKLNQYLDYMSFNSRLNSLTKTECKGIIRQCDEEIAKRLQDIASIETNQKEYSEWRTKIADAAALEINGLSLFTEEDRDDLNIINGMIREQEFSNENIVVTSLDNIVSAVNIQEDLYQSAVAKLHELSQPQYAFRTELDNLYALDAFKAYQKPFDIGNFIRVGLEIHEEICDNQFIKLRLLSISYNPLRADENLSVEFSTMTKTLNGISDLAFLLDQEIGTSSGGSSGSGTGGGTYGNNDAGVQMSNNMLNALLRTEMFGTAVTDVILDSVKANKGNFTTLFSNSGMFDSLESGYLKVNGDCLFGGSIKSNNWNGTDNNVLSNTEGSILDLSNGQFNLGGKLKWNGTTLSIEGNGKFTGDIVANSITLSNKSAIFGLSADKLVDASGFVLQDVSIGAQSENHCTNYIRISSDGRLEADNAVIHGTFISSASASKRHMQDISYELNECFDPHSIYNLPVCQFRYNAENGGGDGTQLHVGFTAEDVAEYYPAAARWNNGHTKVEAWEIYTLFPAVVKLTQEQYIQLQAQNDEIQQQYTQLQTQNNEVQQLRTQLQAQNGEVQQLCTALETMKQRLQELEKKLEEMNAKE